MKLSTWWRKVRVTTNIRVGYRVEVKYIWFPFWLNVYSYCYSVEEAIQIANNRFNSQVGDLL